MKSFAREYVGSEEDAEDIVQDVFLELYEQYTVLSNRVNIIAYIFTTIKNRSIDHLRRKIIAHKSADYMQEEYLLTMQMKLNSLEILDDELFRNDDVEQAITRALNALPERCRTILVKHKIEGQKQKDIAEELGLSIKTVENQLTIAYKKLREELKDYHKLLLLFF
jgi:RNA polymerase sigma-70 factor (ECF subfamily)